MKENLGPAASEDKYAQSKRRDRLLDYQAKEDLKWLLQQPQFRRWAIGHIYASQFCGVNKSIFRANSEMAFLEGRRSVGIDVLATFTNFPELYSQFEQERVQAEVESIARAKVRQED